MRAVVWTWMCCAWMWAVCDVVAAPTPYPNKPIKLIAPTLPGGGVDLVARTVAERLALAVGQPVVVENQSAGGGIVASLATARAAPDGYTLMIGYAGTHGVKPALGTLPYDAVKDFTPIAMVGGTPNVLVVPVDFPADSLSGFVEYVKANPDKLSYGSGGFATMPHLVMEQFKGRDANRFASRRVPRGGPGVRRPLRRANPGNASGTRGRAAAPPGEAREGARR
jgi:tripartite-type tricarboxylate transporter receptor subunit TctC